MSKKTEDELKNPYKDGKASRFWSTAIKDPLTKNVNFDLDNLRSVINDDAIICSAGSCFAQHIGKNLIDRNYKYLLSSFCGGRTESFGLGNIYTTRQLRQWLEFCLDNRTWSDETYFQSENCEVFDYLIPHLPPVNSTVELKKRRYDIAREFITNFKKANIFIFTCGLTEQWQTKLNEAIAAAPGTLVGKFDPVKHQLTNLDVSQILLDLKKIETMISEINSKITFIYTVSPVPLTATATTENVLTANNFSKAKLRAAVGEHVLQSSKAMYFPSYEIITYNLFGDWRFHENLRTISDMGVNLVMRHAFDEHCSDKGAIPTKTGIASNSDIHCEEQKLETLNRTKNLPIKPSQLFLIGDSQMGKLAEKLVEKDISFYGGQIMNASGFALNKFSLDEKKIFLPEEDPESTAIWERTFESLEHCKGDAVIYTNIGFQAGFNIIRAVNFKENPALTLKDLADYFSEFHSDTMEILSRLNKFGRVNILEDPNCCSIIRQHHAGEDHFKVMKLNFATYCQFLNNLSATLGCNYFSNFSLISQQIFNELGALSEIVLNNDAVHASPIYYEKLADKILKDENLL